MVYGDPHVCLTVPCPVCGRGYFASPKPAWVPFTTTNTNTAVLPKEEKVATTTRTMSDTIKGQRVTVKQLIEWLNDIDERAFITDLDVDVVDIDEGNDSRTETTYTIEITTDPSEL